MKPTCAYILGGPAPAPFHRCGKPVSWKTVRDDDQQLTRKYEPFCPEHMKVVAAQKDDDETSS